MRIPASLAWLMLMMAFFTAGLLRQFHDRTPESPLASPMFGSLLFGAIFLVLLISAREWRLGAVPGPGVRLGSITPLLLMLLVEKWISISIYPNVFFGLADMSAPPTLLDAWYRAFAGVSLILTCLLVARFSRPTRRKVWSRARPSRWPLAALGTLGAILGTYLLLGGLAWSMGARFVLALPQTSRLWTWVVGGQAILAFAEEVYYRGLLLSEVRRVAPRLGVSAAAARRWIALLATSVLFGLEHFALGPPWGQTLRQLTFTVSLGLLLGILVMVSDNLHFAAGIHAWINWLLLGAVPLYVLADGRPALPPGTYIGLTLILAFVLAFLFKRRGERRRYRVSDELPES